MRGAGAEKSGLGGDHSDGPVDYGALVLDALVVPAPSGGHRFSVFDEISEDDDRQLLALAGAGRAARARPIATYDPARFQTAPPDV